MKHISLGGDIKNAARLLCILVLIAGQVGCKQLNVFEQNTVIPNHQWTSDFSADGSFEITDTVSKYQLFIVLRHTDAYRYNNIWLRVGLQTPGDSLRFQKVNLQLGTDATGWYGTGMNDIFEVRRPLTNKAMRFIHPGVYQFKIFHIMRDEPLAEVISVGMRLERDEEIAEK